MAEIIGFFRALFQLRDRRFRRVLIRSVAYSAVLIVGFLRRAHSVDCAKQRTNRLAPGDSMITQTGNRSCRRGRDSLFRIAIGAMILSMSGCAEIELGAEVYKTYARANEPPPVSPSPARQDSIDPSMHPDPSAFHAADLAQWDGVRTLPGIWIAHPMAETARRVRLTNGETGAQVDAAMFRRDPNLSGLRIIVSSEAAERLGLMPGHATPVTIEGLAYRVDTEAVAL